MCEKGRVCVRWFGEWDRERRVGAEGSWRVWVRVREGVDGKCVCVGKSRGRESVCTSARVYGAGEGV